MSTDMQPMIAFFVILFLAVYMLPTVIAAVRGHPNVMPIAIINLFFGWTVIGYVVCLAWSFTSIDRRR